MKLEDTSDDLHDLGLWLFQFMRNLGGGDHGDPLYQQSGGWYRAPAKGKACLYIYFAGPSRNSKHPNTAHLATLWDDELKSIAGVEQGNNWFGSRSADLYLSAGDPHWKVKAERFVRRAFKVVAVDIYLKSRKDPTSPAERRQLKVSLKELSEKIAEITDDAPQAPAAAKWLKKKLAEVGVTAGEMIRDILVNVASDVVTKILWGG